ncbi:piggyBac transposable element-derived protein 4-like [Hydra vulgaris]|uniref:PiggyBac transposable element-derived protein 4-like n=1 Tax=Hydra vulgaris TaxID=6087 RepID=A0ABM4BZ20_HYDVU
MKTKMKLQRGYSDWRMCGPVLAQVWIDSKPVHILSTILYPNYDDEVANSTIYVKRKGKNGAVGGINVPCPPAIKDYNANMGGIDSADQIMKYYNCGRKSSKWYRRIFCHLLEICVHNAFVLEPWFTDQRARSHQSFREELIDQVIGSTSSKNSGRPSNSNEDIALRHTNVGVHKPLVNDKPRDCKNCSENVRKTTLVGQSQCHSKGIRRSRVFFSLCNIHLCLDLVSNCWNMWHS